MLGPALAGVLILAGGTSICFGLNAVSFVFVIGALLMMRPEELTGRRRSGAQKGQLTDGLRYIWEAAELRWILLLMLVVGTFAINSPVVLPLLAKITFHGGPEVYSWMSIAMGAGAIFGALFAANRSDTHGQLLAGTGMAFGVADLRGVVGADAGVVHRAARRRRCRPDRVPLGHQLLAAADRRTRRCAVV